MSRRLTDPRNFGGYSHGIRASFGLHQDSALTTAATADTDPVGGWLERELRGFNYGQATAGNRPTLLLGATPVGGPAVRFTAASSRFMSQVNRLGLQQNRTVIAAFRPVTISGTVVLFGNGTTNWFVGFTTSATLRASHAKADTTQQNTTAPNNAAPTGRFAVFGWRWQWDAGVNVSVGMWRNGALVLETPYATGLAAVTGTTWRLGTLAGAGNFVDGDLAALDFYARDLTDQEMADAMGDVMVEHGIS